MLQCQALQLYFCYSIWKAFCAFVEMFKWRRNQMRDKGFRDSFRLNFILGFKAFKKQLQDKIKFNKLSFKLHEKKKFYLQ